MMRFRSNTISKFLMDSKPITIIPELAEAIGLNQAIFIQQLHFLLQVKEQGYDITDLKEGRLWVYNSLAEWREKYFRFWSDSTVKRTINELVQEGLILKCNFNYDKRDQRLWYTIEYDKLDNTLDEYKQKLIDKAIDDAEKRSQKEP